MGVNNLPKVVTQRCLEQDSNPWPTDRKPKCLTRYTTAPPELCRKAEYSNGLFTIWWDEQENHPLDRILSWFISWLSKEGTLQCWSKGCPMWATGSTVPLIHMLISTLYVSLLVSSYAFPLSSLLIYCNPQFIAYFVVISPGFWFLFLHYQPKKGRKTVVVVVTAKRLAGKSISEMICLVSSEMKNLNSIKRRICSCAINWFITSSFHNNDGWLDFTQRISHCLLTQTGGSFWATVCKTVRPMLSVRCPVCPVLSVLSCLSVTFVHCGQTVGWVKTKLVM